MKGCKWHYTFYIYIYINEVCSVLITGIETAITVVCGRHTLCDVSSAVQLFRSNRNHLTSSEKHSLGCVQSWSPELSSRIQRQLSMPHFSYRLNHGLPPHNIQYIQYVDMPIWINVITHAYTCIHMHIYIYICLYICIYIYIYSNIHRINRKTRKTNQ